MPSSLVSSNLSSNEPTQRSASFSGYTSIQSSQPRSTTIDYGLCLILIIPNFFCVGDIQNISKYGNIPAQYEKITPKTNDSFDIMTDLNNFDSLAGYEENLRNLFQKGNENNCYITNISSRKQ